MTNRETIPCPSCKGEGYRGEDFCEPCWGKGVRTCVHGPDGCGGSLGFRSPGYGRAMPLCSTHGESALKRERELRRKYGTDACEPEGFDSMDAGEVLR